MAKCMYPHSVERQLYYNQESKFVNVPCGRCPECLKRRLHSWAFRLEIEKLNWQKNYFLTLTYDNKHCPMSANGFMTLFPKHLVDYFKRLRKRSGKLKYYLVGEYGTNRKRPHYHVILFGQDSLFVEDIIKEWPKGDVYFGEVTVQSINYCVQYYDKGSWHAEHVRDDRVPEFQRVSQGLGKSFLSEKMIKFFLENPDRGYIYNLEGRKIAIPRYYKKRLYDYLQSSAIAEHPSLLLHRDEMLEKKEIHHKAIADVMQQYQEEEVTERMQEDRKWAIINYRNQKRKTRNL